MRIWKREEGQALVETAVSAGLLFAMLLGAAEFSQLAYYAIEVSNSAKAAALYGAQNHSTATNVAGMLAAAQSENSAVTLVSPTTGGFTTTDGYTCTCSGGGTTSVSCSNNSVTSPSCSNSYTEVTLTVQTQVSFTPVVHIPGITGPFKFTATAKQKVIQ